MVDVARSASLLDPLPMPRGPALPNRFMLAPLTNSQSHDDGRMSDEEFHWLTMRAQGGFGLTMTCAAHVQAIGKGFPGQMGVFADDHVDGLTRLADAIGAAGSVSNLQLYHGGMRCPAGLIGQTPVSPSGDESTAARALSRDEVKRLVDDFIAAARRAERSGFDGGELHGAHGYILCQFFSVDDNRRDDEYGGDRDGRYRILFELIDGIRAATGSDFQLGVRLSPERFGMDLGETKAIAERLAREDKIDFLDMSLWDSFKAPADPDYADRSLLEHFTGLERGNVRLGVAGKVRTPAEAERAFASGVDWLMLGRAAILHHDFPDRYRTDPRFAPVELPVTRAHLAREGLSPPFVEYMAGWQGFVAD